MNTWFKFFLLPKSSVTVFVDLDLQEFGLLGLRGLPWISQVNQSTGLPSIFLRAHTEHFCNTPALEEGYYSTCISHVS